MIIRGTSAPAVVVMLFASACGSGGSTTPAADQTVAPSAPASVDMVVTMRDRPPLDFFFNAEGQGAPCTSVNVSDAIADVIAGGDGEQPPTQVVVRDADDSIVATKELPKRGGNWTGSGCEWELSFPEVARSSFYTVTISSKNGEQSVTVEAGSDVGTVSADLIL